jgi:glycosyltransferase involved in cell wall biosynthesis
MKLTGMQGPEFSIVLPAYNESRNIAPMSATLKSIMATLGASEIIFVNDGSSDETLPAIREAALDPQFRYISFTRNFGHQQALRAGLRHTRGRAVVVLDADFEHPPELIPEMVAAWRSEVKIVTTQRTDDKVQVSLMKRLSSNLYYRLLDTIGDVRIPPGSADFMLLDRSVVDVINRVEDQDIFLRGFVRWLGFPMATIPFSRGRRRQGDTKYSWRRMFEFALMGIAAHSMRPLRIAVWLALAFVAIGLLLLAYTLVTFFFVEGAVLGWSSIMAAISILGAAQLFVLGVLGEYIGRILRETRRRPSYIVAETELDREIHTSAADDTHSYLSAHGRA